MTHYGFTSFPHPGACEDCRAEHRCNFCGNVLTNPHCTNGRCWVCHREECTPGGDTSPGHGFGPYTPSPTLHRDGLTPRTA